MFYSYAHEDERLRKKLETHLALLQQQGLITAWHDREISAGTEWANEINAHLETAQIILLLVSSSFLPRVAQRAAHSDEVASQACSISRFFLIKGQKCLYLMKTGEP